MVPTRFPGVFPTVGGVDSGSEQACFQCCLCFFFWLGSIARSQRDPVDGSVIYAPYTRVNSSQRRATSARTGAGSDS